jgi:hypothetical protein
MSFYPDFVIPPTLATPTDLANYTGAASPTNAIPLLRSASLLVLRETRGAYYDVTTATGLATDAQIGLALNQATCAQAAAWASLGYDPLTGGVLTTGVESSTKIGSAAITFADGALVAAAKASAITELVPEARRILEMNNLLVPWTWTFG